MIDEAVIDLMEWVEGKANEKKIGKAGGKQPGKGETWVPKYATLGDILDEYEGVERDPDAPAIDPAELDALVAAMDAQADVEF